MKIKTLLVILLSAASALAAEVAPFQLKGVLNTGKEKLFGLSTSTGDKSAWLSIGQKFEGYTLKSYDDAKGLLTLENAGKPFELSLSASKIVTAEGAKGTPATVADAAAVIDRMRFEELITRTLESQKKAMSGMAVQMAKRSGSNVDPKDVEEFQNKMMDAMIEAMNVPQLKKDLEEIYARTFSKEELSAMSDFYATPVGQATIDKQPAVQEQLQAVMMPRIMAAMPKLQQLGAEFAQKQQAKAQAAAAAAAPTAASQTPAATK